MVKNLRPFILGLQLIFIANILSAQCTDGSQPECTCGTAPVLCTVDDLDNYMFSMSPFMHPQDGPTPLCSGAGGSVPNNPTWFAFTAWCTDLTLEASFSNCTGVGGSNGVQIAIYGDCSFNNQVACNVSPANCNTADKVLVMSGLTIGGVYYFLVDGCLGSYCDVTIDIIGVCGEEEIAPWTMPVMGELNPCAGDLENYTVEALDGAATYHWYIDNALVDQTSIPSLDYTWSTAGTFQLCVDASNDPCVPESDDPLPLCTTINVYDSDAGTLMVTPQNLCPGDVANISVSNYLMGPNNQQAILITDENGVIVEVINGDSGTFTSAVCGIFTVYSYNYNTPIGTTPVIGGNVNDIDCTIECCNLESLPLSFEDSEVPTFPNPPADMTVSCSDLIPMMTDLQWDDNCDGTGMVPGMESGTADACTGGSIIRTWEYTDSCGNTATYSQTITVDPIAAPTFTNPPADMTVDCNNIPSSVPDLAYTNNGFGACDVSGTVAATSSGTADICGGTISYTWTFTDACSNTITHTQNITVTPADAPFFINPPADQTVDCDNIPTGAGPLNYDNNGVGACSITGMVPAVQSGSADICGGTITYTWEFTDQCNNTITHSQNITVTPAAPPTFTNPPADITVDCNNIPSGTPPDLGYTNNGFGACLISGTVPAMQSGSADVCGGILTNSWTFTDQCNNTITHVQRITVDPATPPAFVNPPGDMTVSCDNIPSSAADLSYTNNGVGACLISGNVSPVQSGNGDICGGTITFTWSFTDACGAVLNHVQNITITPAAAPVFQNPPADMTVSCNNIPAAAGNLNYTNNETGACLISGTAAPLESGSANECGGTITNTWEFTDQCNNTITHVQNITVDPAPPASFTGVLPADISVDCDAVPTTAPPLSYDNNESGVCQISGTQAAVQVGSYTACGGTFQFLWEFTDDCGRTISHTQNINVNPAPMAAFVNPPVDITLDCSNVPATPPSLSFTNGQSGTCNLSNSIQAIQSGSYDACGGNITYNWVFTDACNRTISHSQNVQVNPASDPIFINPPADITISCGQPFPDPFDLFYSNSETGACGIDGSVLSIVSISGLTAFYTWNFTNSCNGATIIHNQTVTQTAEPDIQINPIQAEICLGQIFDLGSITVTDINNTNPIITFHSGTPASLANQLPSSIVSPTTTTTYYILASNSNGCSDETSFDLIITPPPFAGFDGMGTVCFGLSNNVNLFDYLLGSPDQNGTWVDTYSYGVDVTNPYNVNLSILAPGNYTFDYFLPSGGVCPDDMASISLELLPELFIEVSNIACAADPNFYEVIIETFGFEVVPLVGTVTDLGGNQLMVTDIPIGTLLLISYTNPGFPECTEYFPVAPPDCDCPIVDPPMSNGDAVICQGETNPELSVSVGTDQTANWYDAPSGGALLIGNSTTYTPIASAPGVYIYFVQAVEISSGCVSSLLTQVVFEILANPIGNNAQLSACDIDGSGFAAFDLSLANSQISADPSFTYTYHENLLDAQMGMNPLPIIYTNTLSPTQTIFAQVISSTNCIAVVEIALLVNPQPQISLQIENETCPGDGNGSVTINSPTGINYSLDSLTWTGTNIFDNLIPGIYTAYTENAMGCIASIDFVIDPGLELLINTFDITCDNNGTASDATDDFYTVNFNLTNNNSNLGTFTLNDGTFDIGSYNYDENNSITIPAQGQSLTLSFSDDLLGCSITQPIGPLTSCSTDCTISITQLSFNCGYNGTPSDPSDDFYAVTINASAVNGAANGTYNVLIDATLSYNFPYGVMSTFNLPADGSSPIIAVVDNEDGQCQASQSIGPLTPCSVDCDIEFLLLEYICNDNGTLTDPADDFYNISILANPINPGALFSFEVFANTISQGIFTYSAGATFTLPADGTLVDIQIQDANDATCTASQSIGALASCEEDCTISATVSNVVCDDNGTGNDSSDDSFTFDLFVSGQNTGSGWQSLDGTISGNYGVVENFGPYLITGGTLNFDLQDLTTLTCQTPITIDPPMACSDACNLNIDLLDIACDDNGTLTDPADDFYNITIQASAINPGVLNSFEVFANAVSQGIFTYSAGATFTLPADGTLVDILVQDANDANCAATQSIGVLASCEEDCTISATVSNVVCNDNGTGNDSSDDSFTFDLFVSGQNTGSGWQSLDGTISGNFGVVENFGPYLITGGTLNFGLQDLTTLTCQTPITIDPPLACSDACNLNIDLLDIACDDNGTLTDPADDFYNITIQVSAINPGVLNSFEVFANAISQGIFTYSAGATFTLPADGALVDILVQDANDANCAVTQSIGVLASCEEDCTISATVSNIVCNDNGTGNDSSDDSFTFDLFVSGQNMGSEWQSLDGTISGNYGVVENFGPYLITGGTLNFDLQDLTTLTCQTPITIDPPLACSDACNLNIDLLDIACDDNGTLTDPADDFYNITIQASAINPGALNSFEVFANAISQGIFTYSVGATFTLPADGTLVDILIQDANDANCAATQSIGVLASCEEDCTISATVSNIICHDNGTGNDSSDDSFTFDLFVSGQNTGSGWQSLDGTISGNFGVVENFGPYLITGGTLNFDLQDLTTLTCQTPITIDPPLACSNCNQTISASSSDIINCDNLFAHLNGFSSAVGNYLWTGPASFSSNNLSDSTNVPGWYFLTVSFPDNCVSIDSVLILADNTPPFADAGPDLIITCDQQEVLIDGSGSIGNNLQYQWTNEIGTIISDQESFLWNAAGNYTLQVTDIISGCSSTDLVAVFDSTTLPSAIIYADPGDILDCLVSTIDLSSNNQPNVIYSWNNFISPTFIVLEPGTVDLIAIDTITGCQNFNQIEILDLQDYPLIDLEVPTPLSCYDEEVIIDGSGSQINPNIIYNWYDPFENLIAGENGNTLLVDQGGFYIFQVIDTLNGCENSDTIFVDALFNTPLAQATEDVTLYCGESLTNLNVDILSPLDEVTINWNTAQGNILSGADGQTPLVEGSGIYTVNILNTLNGCATTDSLNVFVNTNYPELLLAQINPESCWGDQNGAISLTNVSGGEEPFIYSLNGINSADDNFENLSPGDYTLQLTDDNGCTLDSTFTIEPGINLELDLPLQLELIQDQFGSIEAIINVPEEDIASIQWNPPGLLSCDTCLITNIQAVGDENFQLIVLHENGCLAIANIRILVRDKASVYIPNGFSPNGDGNNDVFTVFANEEVEEILQMSIFDRWGELIFKNENFGPNDLNLGWDGTFRGQGMNPAVFVYMIQVKLKNGNTEQFSGDVTLIR